MTVRKKTKLRAHYLKKKKEKILLVLSSPILIECKAYFHFLFLVGAYGFGSSRVNNISLLISMRRKLNKSLALSHLELNL